MKGESFTSLAEIFCGGLEPAVQEQTERLLACNAKTEAYGLRLTEQQAQALAVTRREALSKAGRMELGAGITEKLILAFCGSPYLCRENYEEVLQELVECFYLFKNETMDCLSDDALIRFLKAQFDGPCGGSVRMLSEDALPDLVRRINRRQTITFSETRNPNSRRK